MFESLKKKLSRTSDKLEEEIIEEAKQEDNLQEEEGKKRSFFSFGRKKKEDKVDESKLIESGEEEADEEPETTEVVAEAMVRPQEDIEEPPKAEAQPEKSSEASRSLDMAEAEEKARQWVREGLQRLVEEAAEKMEAAKAREDSADAALWDLRRAAANLAIEAMS